MLKLSASYFVNELVSKEVFMSAILEDEETGIRLEHFGVQNYPQNTPDEKIAARVGTWAVSTTGFNEGTLELSSDPNIRLESLYGYPNVQIESVDTGLSESFKALHPVIKQALAG